MRAPHQDDWNEFNDHEIVRWKRARAIIEHENTLINHRLTWFFSSQGFLLAAFTLFFSLELKDKELSPAAIWKINLLLLSIAGIGLVVSYYLYRGIRAAQDHLDRADNWYHGEVEPARVNRRPSENEPKRSQEVAKRLQWSPPLQGMGDGSRMDRALCIMYVPYLFCFIWGGVLIVQFFIVASMIYTAMGLWMQWPFHAPIEELHL